MIYLIDDNQNNQRFVNYNLTFIEDGIFKDILISVEKLSIGKKFSDITHLDFLKSAECILLHSTTEDYDEKIGFIPSSLTNVSKIKEFISNEGESIPLVLFSNSISDVDYDNKNTPNYISGINKNLFYNNLFDFLEFYRETGKVELRILALGKFYESQLPLEIAKGIINSLQSKKNNDELLISDILPLLGNLKILFKNALPDISLNDILIHIEDTPIKVEDFKKNINRIIESYIKYGKNIHTWKK